FRRRDEPAFASRSKIAGLGHQGPRRRGLPARPARALSTPAKAAMGAVSRRRTNPMANNPDTSGAEPVHSASQTAHALTELQLYGWHPFQDEPDPRPLPEGDHVNAAVADIFDALVATLGETRL